MAVAARLKDRVCPPAAPLPIAKAILPQPLSRLPTTALSDTKYCDAHGPVLRCRDHGVPIEHFTGWLTPLLPAGRTQRQLAIRAGPRRDRGLSGCPASNRPSDVVPRRVWQAGLPEGTDRTAGSVCVVATGGQGPCPQLSHGHRRVGLPADAGQGGWSARRQPQRLVHGLGAFFHDGAEQDSAAPAAGHWRRPPRKTVSTSQAHLLVETHGEQVRVGTPDLCQWTEGSRRYQLRRRLTPVVAVTATALTRSGMSAHAPDTAARLVMRREATVSLAGAAGFGWTGGCWLG